jgi:hypothetical protein
VGTVTIGTLTVTVRTGVETVVDAAAIGETDATGLVTARTVLAAAATGSGDCGSLDAAGAPPEEIEPPLGALRSVPCPATAGRE